MDAVERAISTPHANSTDPRVARKGVKLKGELDDRYLDTYSRHLLTKSTNRVSEQRRVIMRFLLPTHLFLPLLFATHRGFPFGSETIISVLAIGENYRYHSNPYNLMGQPL